MPDTPTRAVAFILIVGGTVLVGGLAGAAGSDAESAWYRGLDKPAGVPPDWVFGAVWTALYVTMGVAAWRVWSHGEWAERSQELSLYGMQLALNVLWPFVFFQAERAGAALVEILVLLAAVAGTLVAFWRVDRPAGWLFVPYLAWLVYAGALNTAIWWLHR